MGVIVTASCGMVQRTDEKSLQLKIISRTSPVVENLPANAGDTGSSPGLGRSHMPRSN